MRGAFVAPTGADYRSVMIEGESGILAVSRPDNMPTFIGSRRLLIWPNGARVELFSAEEPERLRGPQHEFAWCDELCAWKYLDRTWDMLQFGLRLGNNPRCFISTTPKPSAVLKSIVSHTGTATTRGSTYDNAANLAPQFLSSIVKRYEGTRLGRQELNAEVLEDMPGALWSRDRIDALRIKDPARVRGLRFKRIVVAVDPSGSDGETGAQQGIVVVAEGFDGLFYVLRDASMAESPDKWGKAVVKLWESPLEHSPERRGDLIVAERNFGGDMVRFVIQAQNKNAPVRMVNASQNKHVRAEPIAALYEQGRVIHCGTFPHLEDQMCLITHDGFQGAGSPDRLDALVWGLTELAYPGKRIGVINKVVY